MNILFNNVAVVDHYKNKAVVGGVAVVDSRISEVFYDKSFIPSDHFDRIIDGKGKFLLPGFWDVHSKGDLAMVTDPSRYPALSQGVVTEVIGQDGLSVAPISQKNLAVQSQFIAESLGNPQLKWRWETVSQYLDMLHTKIGTNVLFYAPLKTLKIEAIGHSSKTLSHGIGGLEYLFEKCMDDGAIGLSTTIGNEEELMNLLPILKRYNGVLCVNVEQSRNVIKDLDKYLQLARHFGVRLHISRLVIHNLDELSFISSLIEKKKKDTNGILIDMSPYTSRLLKLSVFLPEWAKEMSSEDLLNRLKKPENVQMLFDEFNFDEDELEQIMLVSTGKRDIRKHEGRNFGSIALERDVDVHALLLDLIVFDSEGTLFQREVMSKKLLEKCFDIPNVVPASSGFVDGRYVPDMYNFVPMYFNSITNGNIFSLVNRLCMLPADFYNIKWGVRKGLVANLVLLDSNEFIAEPDYLNPRNLCGGVDMVVVNGKIVSEKCKLSGLKTGQVLSWF